MAALLYKDDHNKVAYLEKGKGWEAYEHILDFLNRSHIRYALTHQPTIVFDSLVKQFWATASVRTLEAGPSDIIATINGNEVVVTESLIRTQLQLNDVNGFIPAGGVLVGSVDSAGFGYPAASESVHAVFNPDLADNSTLPPGHSFGSSEYSTRFPSPSDLGNHQPQACIFSSSSYDDDFCADVTNLASKPSSVAKALEDPDWVASMQKEMQQFFNQQVWKLVPLPDGKIAIGTKQILKNKRDARGIVVRNKARLVAQGHRQEEGIDYDEVFAPVARIEAIRLFLAFASYIGFMVYQMDVKSVVLYGEIEEEVYVTQPKGFEDPHNPKHVYRVIKAFQDKYVKDMLKKFDMESVRTATTPYEVLKPKLKDEPDDAVNFHLYRSMIGSLMYLTASRPDIIDSPFKLEAYSDSDYAESHGDKKSTTGGCQFLGRRLISWQCKKQTIVATSSSEAEYVAAASCYGQVLWIQNQMLDYRDGNEKNLIQVLKIHSDDNVADLLTKAFDGPRFHYLQASNAAGSTGVPADGSCSC
nr:copia protein [Tanacetum cinerariifolium]